jgi:hypothetical protein
MRRSLMILLAVVAIGAGIARSRGYSGSLGRPAPVADIESGPPAINGGPLIDLETYSVFAAVVAATGHPPGSKGVVCLETWGLGWDDIAYYDVPPSDWSAVVDAYNTANSRFWDIQPVSPFGPLWTISDKRTIEASLKGDAKQPGLSWDGFRRQFPNAAGLLEVSAVGFDRTATRALLRMSYRCGGLCGSGGWLALEKVDDAWRVVEPAGLKLHRWVS